MRAYLMAYGSSFVSLSLEHLQTMFSIPLTDISRICTRMIVNDQLAGVWDQPTNCIMMIGTEPSRLQKAALSFTDKVSVVLFVSLDSPSYSCHPSPSLSRALVATKSAIQRRRTVSRCEAFNFYHSRLGVDQTFVF